MKPSRAQPSLQSPCEHAAGVEPALPVWKTGASLSDRPRVRGVEGGNRTRACAGLQSAAFPSWRPRQRKRAKCASLGGVVFSDNPARAVRSALVSSAEEAGRVELPGPWPGRLAPDCAKPTCASLPWRRAEHSKPTLSRQSAFEAAPAPWLVHPPCESQESNLLSLPCRGSAVPSGSTRVSTAATPTGFEPVFLP